MANLYRPSYTRTDSETGEKTVHRLRKWYGKYCDADGVPRRVPLCTDKTAAQAMLAELVRKAERQQAGVVDRSSDELARSIGDHLADYRKHLLAKARCEKHINDTIRLVEKVTAACRCRILADLQGGTDALEGYLADRLESGSSHRTVNADLVANAARKTHYRCPQMWPKSWRPIWRAGIRELPFGLGPGGDGRRICFATT